MLLAIFDSTYEMLGEVAFHGGAFRQIFLLPSGEQRLGNYIELWQSRGVPAKKQISADHHESHFDAFVVERVSFQSSACQQVMKLWLLEQGFLVMEVQDVQVDCWKRLAQLPMNPFERYVYGAALLASKNTDTLTLWKKALEDAWQLFIREQTKANKAVEQLKKKVAPHVVKSFASAGT